MRILWIVNMVLPPLAQKLNIKTGNSGTWMFDIANKLSEDHSVELAVACVYGNEFKKHDVNGTTYYCLPGNGKDMIFYRKHFKKYWKQIVDDFKPDIVNIHGTEYCHALSFVREFPKIKTVVSLQGVLTRLKDKDLGAALVLPDVMLRHENDKFLDDLTVEDIETALNIPVYITASSGEGLVDTVLKIIEEKEAK